MVLNDAPRLDKSAFLILPVLALAFYIAFIPHQSYLYPLHVDEWVHWVRSDLFMAAGDINYSGSFLLEIGYHVFWGVFQTISGISWLDIFRYFPSIVFVFTALSVYILGQREGFGLEAAFFTCLIPTTVGILGPAFLVPVSMGLLFTPLILFIAFYFRTVWSYILIFILICFLLSIHAPSAICPIIVLIPYILINLKGNFRHSLGMILVLVVPFLAVFPWIFDMLLPTAKSLFIQQPVTEYVQLPRIINTYGYIPMGFCLLGIFLLAFRGGKQNYGLIVGLLALLLMLVTFFTFHYGVPIMYERGLMFMMLMVGIVAGAGLMVIKNLPLPEWLKAKMGGISVTRYLGWFLCLVVVGITLYISVPYRQSIPYYHMIDDEDYQAFVWIRDNVGEEYNMAVLEPWKATAFTAITEKEIYTRIHAYPKPSDIAARKFLEEGCSDTEFLRGNGISIVYTDGECQNPDLVEVNERVYLLQE